MVQGFESLTDQQFAILKDAIAQITVLIAGADGEIDPKETEWATKLTHIRSYNTPQDLNGFYEAVGHDFSDKLNSLITNSPKDTGERTAFLTSKLSEVNDVLSCVENNLAAELYKSFLSFAKHVAKASGGFFGMMSVSSEEANLMDLKMIDPIEITEEE
jgi:hypothetical protein